MDEAVKSSGKMEDGQEEKKAEDQEAPLAIVVDHVDSVP